MIIIINIIFFYLLIYFPHAYILMTWVGSCMSRVVIDPLILTCVINFYYILSVSGLHSTQQRFKNIWQYNHIMKKGANIENNNYTIGLQIINYNFYYKLIFKLFSQLIFEFMSKNILKKLWKKKASQFLRAEQSKNNWNIKYHKEKQHVLTFDKPETANVWHFCLKKKKTNNN